MKYRMPTAKQLAEVKSLHHDLLYGDCIDDSEDLLNDLPDYLEMILALAESHNKLFI